MSQAVLNALRSKLVTYESAGMDDMVRRVKDRIARIEKAMVAESEAAAPAPAAPKKSTAKPTAKKAAKKAGR